MVNHPLRRRMVMHLMLLGNAGIVIAVASLAASFLNTSSSEHWTDSWWFRIAILVTGVFVLWFVANSRHVEQVMWRANTWALRRWLYVDIQDYARLLRFSHNYVVWEMHIQPENWLAGRTLAESALTNEGILVLGIERSDGKYLGAPRGTRASSRMTS